MIRFLVTDLVNGWQFYVIHYNLAESLERFNLFRSYRRTLLDGLK